MNGTPEPSRASAAAAKRGMRSPRDTKASRNAMRRSVASQVTVPSAPSWNGPSGASAMRSPETYSRSPLARTRASTRAELVVRLRVELERRPRRP